MSPYNYVGNNPIIRIDPDGRSFLGAYDMINHTGSADLDIFDEDGYADKMRGAAGDPNLTVIINGVQYNSPPGTSGGGGGGNGIDATSGPARSVQMDDSGFDEIQGPEFTGGFWDWLNKINNFGNRHWVDPETGLALIIDDQGNVVRDAPTTGIAPSPRGKSGAKWAYGSFKSVSKWTSQFLKRGWTPQKVTEAITKGKSFNAVNMVNKGNGATRYVHPTSGQSVVIDNVTREILHVGGPGFKY